MSQKKLKQQRRQERKSSSPMKISWSIKGQNGSSESEENSAKNLKEKRPNLATEKEQKKTENQTKA
jgi:hypothetical protein